MTANEAYEDGRRQAISPTRFCGDVIKLPPAGDMHAAWMEGFLANLGTFKELGEAYHRWLYS